MDGSLTPWEYTRHEPSPSADKPKGRVHGTPSSPHSGVDGTGGRVWNLVGSVASRNRRLVDTQSPVAESNCGTRGLCYGALDIASRGLGYRQSRVRRAFIQRVAWIVVGHSLQPKSVVAIGLLPLRYLSANSSYRRHRSTVDYLDGEWLRNDRGGGDYHQHLSDRRQRDHGLLSIDKNWLDLFRLHQATRWQILSKLRIPIAVSHLIVGMRISSGMAVIGAIVGEFFVGNGTSYEGLGSLMTRWQTQLKTDLLMSAVATSTLLGIAFFLSIQWLAKTLFKKWTLATSFETNS